MDYQKYVLDFLKENGPSTAVSMTDSLQPKDRCERLRLSLRVCRACRSHARFGVLRRDVLGLSVIWKVI